MVPIMRACGPDAIGQLADGGDDYVELVATPRPARPAQAVAEDVPLSSQVGRSAGGTWLASRAATSAAVLATGAIDAGAASREATSAQWTASMAARSDITAHAAPREGMKFPIW